MSPTRKTKYSSNNPWDCSHNSIIWSMKPLEEVLGKRSSITLSMKNLEEGLGKRSCGWKELSTSFK